MKQENICGYYKRLKNATDSPGGLTVGKIYPGYEVNGRIKCFKDNGINIWDLGTVQAMPTHSYWKEVSKAAYDAQQKVLEKRDEPKPKRPKFKVGHKILGTPNNPYKHTGPNSVCKIIRSMTDRPCGDDIEVTIISNPRNTMIGKSYEVKSEHFVLYDPMSQPVSEPESSEHKSMSTDSEFIGLHERIKHESGDALTVGKVYGIFKEPWATHGYVINDAGNKRRVMVHRFNNPDDDYWKPVSQPTTSDFDWDPADPFGDRGIISPTQPTNPHEATPMQIVDTTLVNGENITDLSDNEILALIRGEQKNATSLRDLGLESVSVAARIEKHESNIKRLVELMDARVTPAA